MSVVWVEAIVVSVDDRLVSGSMDDFISWCLMHDDHVLWAVIWHVDDVRVALANANKVCCMVYDLSLIHI